MTAYGRDLPGAKIGCELIEIQMRTPSPRRMPITTFEKDSPVRSVAIEGWSWPGNGVPSSWMACQSGESEVMPRSWEAERPWIRSAAGFTAMISPVAAWQTTPSAMVANTY